MSLDWNDLRYFLALRRVGSLAGAARTLGVEHSTVSRRLNAIEQALGARLFTRTPDGFVATRAGEEIGPLAEGVEKSIEEIVRRVSGEDDRIAGVVRVTTSEAFTPFLVKRLQPLRERHPDLIVEVLSGNESLDLSRREADLAVRMAETRQPELKVARIASIGWSLYASKSYVERKGRATTENLAGHDVVAYDATMSGVPGGQWIGANSDGANIVMRGNSLLSVLNAVVVGMGVSVLPCFIAEPEQTLVRLTSEVLGSRDVWLVLHPDIARIARVRAVIDYVKEVIQAEQVSLAGTLGIP